MNLLLRYLPETCGIAALSLRARLAQSVALTLEGRLAIFALHFALALAVGFLFLLARAALFAVREEARGHGVGVAGLEDAVEDLGGASDGGALEQVFAQVFHARA